MLITALILGLSVPLLRADGPAPGPAATTTSTASTSTAPATSEPVAFPSARCKISGLEEHLNGIYDYVKMTAGFQSFQHQNGDYKLYALSVPRYVGVPVYWILSSSWDSSFGEATKVFVVTPNRKAFLTHAQEYSSIQEFYTCSDSSANCICSKAKVDEGHCGVQPGCWQESSREKCVAHEDRWLADECLADFSISCFTDCSREHDMHFFCSWEELAITPNSSCSADNAFQFGLNVPLGGDCPLNTKLQMCRRSNGGVVSWAKINAISIALITICMISNLYLLS